MVAQLDPQYRAVVGHRGTWRRVVSYALFEGRPATTRGQWINPFVRANYALGERRRPRRVDRPVFVLGVGRSGTTHLGKLLSAHPDVAWLNEPKLLWSRLVPREDVSGFYQEDGRFLLNSTDVTPRLRARAHAAIGHYLRSVRSSRLVDKYPEMTYRVPFLRELFPDAVLIAIVRRPEDFVNSVVDWNERNTVGAEDWWGVNDCKWRQLCDELVPLSPDVAAAHAAASGRTLTAAERSATEWVLGMRALMEAWDLLDLVVRYEDLAKDPAATMATVISTAGLAPSPRVLALARDITDSRLRTEEADFGVLTEAVELTRERLYR